MSSDMPEKVAPAHLNFLAIYKPELGPTEETERDQVVFYWSRSDAKPHSDVEASKKHDTNEELRQIGLAQGIVNFARGFSDGQPVDAIDTEKHRIVLKELECGWWILASINLTCLPAQRSASASRSTPSKTASFEYSSREVSPATLLQQQLLSAHRIFLLHHSFSLDALYVRARRSKFCNLMDIFWSSFCLDWDVLLHGNPTTDIFDGIKLAAGGELGIGVGEEEWGSGERDALEGLIRDTDGLIDLVVSRYGENWRSHEELESDQTVRDDDQQGWLGTFTEPDPADGVIFTGVGSITRPSLRTLCQWTRHVYMHGENAYGVRDNPSSGRRRRHQNSSYNSSESPKSNTDATAAGVQKSSQEGTTQFEAAEELPPVPSIPRPIVSAAEESLQKATNDTDSRSKRSVDRAELSAASANRFTDPSKWKTYMTMGYGSAWSFTGSLSKSTNPQDMSTSNTVKARRKSGEDEQPSPSDFPSQDVKGPPKRTTQAPTGSYLVGLKGDLDLNDHDPSHEDDDDDEVDNPADWNSRLVLRFVHVALTTSEGAAGSDGSQSPPSDDEAVPRAERVRVVLYEKQPFLFTFIFKADTSSLSIPTFFRRLHKHLRPLYKPLLSSTSPATVADRMQHSLTQAPGLSSSAGSPPIYDIIYGPSKLTLHTTLPNIPLPGTLAAEGLQSTSGAAQSPPWTRIEALNVHSQILSIHDQTRKWGVDQEHQYKTSRGWWVVWVRAAASKPLMTQQRARAPKADNGGASTEAVLVRRARDHGNAPRGGRTSRSGLGRFVGLDSSNAEGNSWSPARLTDGIGIDPRKYVESLLSLNR